MYTLYNNDVICSIRLQTADVVFLWMLLKLHTVPQLEIASKKATISMYRLTYP